MIIDFPKKSVIVRESVRTTETPKLEYSYPRNAGNGDPWAHLPKAKVDPAEVREALRQIYGDPKPPVRKW